MNHELILLCAPSGAGKTTVVKLLRQLKPDLGIGVTYTTRPPRHEITEDKDMRYVSDEEFKKLIADNLLIEHAEFAGHWYGTARQPLEQALQSESVLLNLELDGTMQVKKLYPEAITIFLHPGSIEILEERLKKREDYNPQETSQRLERARADWQHISWFEHQVINRDGHPELAAQEIAELIG